MLCGLWFGPNKPNMNTYMKPFVDECIELYSNGLTWQSDSGKVVTSKVLVTIMLADSVARPLIQNFKQFNGEFGCSFCMQKGTSVLKRRGRVSAYPYENAELRNPSQTDDLVEQALAGNPTKGVKGPSILSCLPGFNIIDGCVPDYTVYNAIMFLHSCYVSFQAIKTRFACVFESEDALLAAMTLPKLRLCWLRDQERKDLAKTSLVAECRKHVPAGAATR